MAHENEHSIEVQVPLIQHLFPAAKIVPIACPPSADAPEIGRLVGRAIQNSSADAVCLGSTDLTHYGRMYGFTPKGTDAAAIRWVSEENDRRMLDLMVRMDAGAIVAEASERLNACGPGAVAATLAAAAEMGATEGRVVQYTTSFDVMREKMGRIRGGRGGWVCRRGVLTDVPLARNEKSETRIKHQIRNPKEDHIAGATCRGRPSDLPFDSGFGFRISGFSPREGPAKPVDSRPALSYLLPGKVFRGLPCPGRTASRCSDWFS